jgi:predicted membrane protein
VGKTNLMIWGYLTVFSALAYGVVIGLRKKKFKNVKIPLLPFIVLSIIIVLLFF